MARGRPRNGGVKNKKQSTDQKSEQASSDQIGTKDELIDAQQTTILPNIEFVTQSKEDCYLEEDGRGINVKNTLEMCKNVQPPECGLCPNRNADRICVNQDCGDSSYMNLICGKCHIESHSQKSEKLEVSVEDFFMGLSEFLDESEKYPDETSESIDTEKLNNAFQQIELLEATLKRIEEYAQIQVQNSNSSQDTHLKLTEIINKTFINPTFENISNQFEEIKHFVSFENNSFIWDHTPKIASVFSKQINEAFKEGNELQRIIRSGFLGGKNFNLEGQGRLISGFSSKMATRFPSISFRNGSILIKNPAKAFEQQFYLDFKLEPEKKYVLRFTVNDFQDNFFFVGLMKRSECVTKLINSGFVGFYFKRFFNMAFSADCSKVLRGQDFGVHVRSGKQYEMRICIQEQILEFSTYPDYKNVVSKLDSSILNFQEDYAMTFSLYKEIAISINSFQEIFEFPPY